MGTHDFRWMGDPPAQESAIAVAWRRIATLESQLADESKIKVGLIVEVDELHAKLAEAERTIERIRGNWAHVAVDYGDDPETPEFDPQVVIQKLRAERDEAKRVARVMAEYLNDRRELRWDDELTNAVDAALRRAMGESDG